MGVERQRGQAGRAIRPWLFAGAVVGLILGGTVAAAPSVEATCGKVIELAALAGESASGSDHEACVDHYTDQRARRGVLGWTWLSWCTWAARSIPEAGQC